MLRFLLLTYCLGLFFPCSQATAVREVGDELSSRVVADAIDRLTVALKRFVDVPQRTGICALASMASCSALPVVGPNTSTPQQTVMGNVRGRSQEALLAACTTLRALCISPRAVRPKV